MGSGGRVNATNARNRNRGRNLGYRVSVVAETL